MEDRLVADGGTGEKDTTKPTKLPAATVTLADFVQVLVDLDLIRLDEVTRLPSDGRRDVPELARSLVQAGRLTPYQAAAASKGLTRNLVIGNFFILGRLGAGGMGVVFKAQHRRLGRVVALKILPPSFAQNRDAVLRFRREVHAAARLDHPNVIAAIDADEDRGVHFMAMEYIDGSDLDRLVAERGPLSVALALNCVIQAARGLAAAHLAGIIHRDIKPSNLMLDRSGTVRVLDLGLARIVANSHPFGTPDQASLTGAGSYMGTADYMAPEQAEDSRSVDGRADIYSLGCTFHFLLTGRPPFGGPNVLKRLMAHQEQPAPSLRAARPDVPEALDAFYLAMMAKQAKDRPASMAEVVQALEACRQGDDDLERTAQAGLQAVVEDVVAQPPSASRRAGASMTRDLAADGTARERGGPDRGDVSMREHDDPQQPPLTVASDLMALSRAVALSSRLGRRTWPSTRKLVAALAVLVVLAPVLIWVTSHGRGPARPPVPNFVSAPAPEKQAPDPSPPARDSGLVKVDSGQGRIPDDSAIPVTAPTPTLPLAISTPPPSVAATVPTPPAPVVATVPAYAGPAPLVEFGRFSNHTHGWVDGLAIAPNGRTLLSACQDGRVRHWDVTTGRELRVLWHPAPTKVVAFLPDGQHAMSGCTDGIVRLWDLRTGRIIHQFASLGGAVDLAMAVSLDGAWVAAGAWVADGPGQGVVRVWNVTTGEAIRSFKSKSGMMSLTFAADGRLLGTDSSGALHLLDTTSGADRTWPAHKGLAWSAAFAPDGRSVISGGDDGYAIVWDLENFGAIRSIHRNGKVRAVRFEADGLTAHLATQIDDQQGELVKWDVKTGRVREVVRGVGHTSLGILPAGDLATADLDGTVRLWQYSHPIAAARQAAKEGKPQATLEHYGRAVAARPDDARLRIERGRHLLVMGRPDEADADFAKADLLGAGNAQLFLDAGWWLAGPYPLDQDIAADRFAALDPSRPPPSSGREDSSWKAMTPSSRGSIAIGDQFPDEFDAVLGVTALYRAGPPGDVALILGADDRAQFRLVGAPNPVVATESWTDINSEAGCLTLSGGRSMIGARVANDTETFNFHLRASDAPLDLARGHASSPRPNWVRVLEECDQAVNRDPTSQDPNLPAVRGIALAGQKKWRPAIEALTKANQLATNDSEHYRFLRDLARVHLAAGNRVAYRTSVKQLINSLEKRPKPTRTMVTEVTWLTLVVPDVPGLENASRLAVSAGLEKGGLPGLRVLGGLLFRKRDYQKAEVYLTQAAHALDDASDAGDWAILAMTQHRLGRPDAQQSLARARELAAAPHRWDRELDIAYLLAEAAQLLK